MGGTLLTDSAAPWSGLVPKSEILLYEAAGYGATQELGRRPAVLVIDVNYRFAGRESLPITEAIARMRTSCGESAWNTLPVIARLLGAARKRGFPVVYTTSPSRAAGEDMSTWRSKNSRVDNDAATDGGADDADIVAEIAPAEGDHVVRKNRPSAFFDTDLYEYLVKRDVDSIVCVGGTTSGCVHGTVVDAFSHGLGVVVLADATFDRADTAHRFSLFDIQAKYGNVVHLLDVAAWWEGLG